MIDARITDLRIVLYGDHVPKARPKIGKRGAYMPARYRSCVSSYRQQMRSAFPQDPWPQYHPVRLEVTYYRKRPTSKPKGVPDDVWASGRAFIATGNVGDCDNIEGTVMDAGNGIIWHDDSQLAPVWCCKWYMAADDLEPERVIMTASEVSWYG